MGIGKVVCLGFSLGVRCRGGRRGRVGAGRVFLFWKVFRLGGLYDVMGIRVFFCGMWFGNGVVRFGKVLK